MEKINIAEILKDCSCPSGMELDCTIYEDVYFDYVDSINIIHCYIQHETYKTSLTFNQYGIYNSGIKAKCVIFPKGKTTWEGFVPPCKFKDGDVCYVKTKTLYEYIFILKVSEDDDCIPNYVTLSTYDLCTDISSVCATDSIKEIRLATEEEKEKLFQAIKDNGYKWNAETKTLDKLPKFKVGDRIKEKQSNIIGEIIDVQKNKYNVRIDDKGLYLYFREQDNWELVPDIKPKFKVGDKIKKKDCIDSRLRTIESINNNYYVIKTPDWFDNCYITDKLPFNCQDKYELVPNKFDISNLKPFDKVLVRCNSLEKWHIQFFEKYNTELGAKYPFICLCNNKYCQCIPYENNQHLLDTANDCNDFYKTWE